LQVSGSRLQVAEGRLQKAGCRQIAGRQVAEGRLQKAGLGENKKDKRQIK